MVSAVPIVPAAPMGRSLRSLKNALRARRAARARPSGGLRRGWGSPSPPPSLVRDLAPERAGRHRWCRPYPRLHGACLRWPAGFFPLPLDNHPRTKIGVPRGVPDKNIILNG